MNDFIRDRDKRTKRRKQKKKDIDSMITLSRPMSPATLASIRLLDEGYVDNGFVIKKGTLEKFLNGKNEYVTGWEFDGDMWVETDVLNLTDEYEGIVNLGHMDFSTFPYIIGSWQKKDLKLVDTGDGRHGIDVTLHLDEDSVFVKELKRQSYDIGVSAEFWYHINWEDTEKLAEVLGYELPVYDEIFITAYALVGECGNVNSSGLELKGDLIMPKDIENILEEELEEAVEEEIEESAVEEEAVGDETEADEVETDDESEDDEAGLEQVEAAINKLREENARLNAEVAELRKTNRRLSKKLKDEKEAKAAFVDRFSTLTSVIDEAPTTNDYIFGDGIGE